MLIGAALCFYFAYHIIYGERSLAKWMSLSTEIKTMSQENDRLSQERKALERKVVMLRPETLDEDLLEERVRAVLGFNAQNERIVISH